LIERRPSNQAPFGTGGVDVFTGMFANEAPFESSLVYGQRELKGRTTLGVVGEPQPAPVGGDNER